MESLSAINQRISLGTQKDVLLGLFFESSLGHIAQKYGEAKRDAVKSEVLKNKNVTTFFRYPVSDLCRIVQAAVPASLEPEKYNSAVEDFGRAAVDYFMDSPVGKTMSMLAGGNVHRLLASAPAGYKAVSSFGQRSYVKIGEREAQMRFESELLGSAWQSGVILEALESACGVQPTVEVRDSDSASTSFVIAVRW